MASKIEISNHPDGYAIRFPFNREFLDKFKATMQQRRWEPESKCWIVAKTRHNEFNLAVWLGQESMFAPYDTDIGPLAVALAEGDKVADATRLPMWSHQYKMLMHGLTRRRCILAGEMRTGKTRPMLRLIETLYQGDQVNRKVPPIWVAPKSAIRGLGLELVKWRYPYPITLMTYDEFRTTFAGLKGNGSIDLVPNVVIFDEAHKLKSPNSRQSQVAEELSDEMARLYGTECPTGTQGLRDYLILVSGTPAPKDPTDWWNLCEIVQPGFLVEASKTELQKRLAEVEEMKGVTGQSFLKTLGWKKFEVEKLYRRLSGLVEVFLKKDCLDLPAKQYEVLTATCSDPRVAAQYRTMASFISANAQSAIQALNELRQVSDGFKYENVPNEETGKMDRVTHRLPGCPKDDLLRSHLEEFEDVGRLIIYCGFQETTDKVVELCLSSGWAVLQVDGRGWIVHGTTLDRDDLLRAMDGSTEYVLPDGSTDFRFEGLRLAFVAQADSASTGLELSASPAIIYFSNSFNGASRMQSEDRAYSNNMDKTRGLVIYDYIHLPTDLLVRNSLLNKKTLQSITMGEIMNELDPLIKEDKVPTA